MKYIPFVIIWLLIVEEHAAYFPIPYLVRIFKHSTSFKCNGILVTKNLVLTSAHCVDWKGGNVSLYLGYNKDPIIKANRDQEAGQCFNSSVFFIHPSFSEPKGSLDYANNDIALIKLPRNAVLNDNVQLGNISVISAQKHANLTGYLQYQAVSVETVIQNEDVCAEAIVHHDKDQHGCVMLPTNAPYSSNWGFGSPVSVYNNAIGFTTHGPSIPSNYVLFVNIGGYKEWIQFHINHNPPYNSNEETVSRYFSLYSVLATVLLFIIK